MTNIVVCLILWQKPWVRYSFSWYIYANKYYFNDILFVKISITSITLIFSSHIVFFSLGVKQNTYLDVELESPPTQSTPKSSSESLFFQEIIEQPNLRIHFFLKAKLANSKLLGLNLRPLGILTASSSLS